jgi:Asp-tRNA(Asn)/Glu-tRNA(Gln) amidotransferase A subunit family amidase
MDFRTTTVTDLAAQVQSGEVSARELTQHALDRISALDDTYGAFVALDGDQALADADALDERRVAGEDVGPLAGIPIGVKDLEDADGFITTFGSVLHAGDAPAKGDSPLVERLRQAGCIVLGKTNTPEHGFKADTTNPLFGSTRNPWDPSKSAGGSSGGSAAAVAAGLVPLATGSDGGGSIRIPSAVCGLAGFKPSLGRVPAGGSRPPDWADLSSKGIIGRRVRDVALALDVVIGPDPTDLRSLPMPEQSWSDCVDDVHLPRRIGWSPDLGYANVDDEVVRLCEDALRRIEEAGTEVVELDSVFDADPVGDWLILSVVANLRNVEHLRGTDDWERIDPELRDLFKFAEHVSATDVLRAADRCHELNVRLVELFHHASFIVTPTVAGQTGPAGGLGTINGKPDVNWVQMTYPFNLTRSPAGTLPVGLTAEGLPVGLQVVGPQHADVAVLRVLAAFEDLLELDLVASV